MLSDLATIAVLIPFNYRCSSRPLFSCWGNGDFVQIPLLELSSLHNPWVLPLLNMFTLIEDSELEQIEFSSTIYTSFKKL